MAAPAPTQTIEVIQQLESDFQVPLYAKRDIALVRGEGAYLYDSEGNRYLDAMSNYGVAILGHADPDFTAALTDQLHRLTTCHQSFYNDTRAAALSAIAAIAPDGLPRIFLTNSGSESIEVALKFALATTGRNKIVSARRGYHGRTLGALAVTADPKYRSAFEPFAIEVEHVAFNSIDALESAIDINTAAVFLEPVQGEAGIYPADNAYLQAARDLTRTYGALLVFDEVQTGFRTGAPFASSHPGVVPDLLCTAKAIANGFPIGVTLVTDDIAQNLPGGTHGTTFGANPLAARAVVSTLETLESRDLYSRSQLIGEQLVAGIRNLEKSKVREVRGRGMMIGIELKQRVTGTLKSMQERGVLALPASPVVLRLLPPLVWEQHHVNEFLEVFDDAVS